MLDEVGFGVEGVDVADAAVVEDRDDSLGLAREVRLARGHERSTLEELVCCQAGDAAADAVEELSAGPESL